MKRLNSTVFGWLLFMATLYAFFGTLFSMVKYQVCIQSPITRAQALTDPVQIAQELARSELATTQVINEGTFGAPTKLVQFRNLLRDLKDHLAQASSMTDQNVLELRNEIQGLGEPRFELLLIEIFSVKWLLVAVLIAITVFLGLREDHRLSISGRI